jgi:hypothetical protein
MVDLIWIAQNSDIQRLTKLVVWLWVPLSARCTDGSAPVSARRVSSVYRVTICSYCTCTVYLVLRCFRGNSVTLPNRCLTPDEYRRSLAVVPSIADRGYYGETTAGLLTYQQDWPVTACERCGAKGWAFTQASQVRRDHRGVGSRQRARAQARSGTLDLHIGTRQSPKITILPRVGYQ